MREKIIKLIILLGVILFIFGFLGGMSGFLLFNYLLGGNPKDLNEQNGNNVLIQREEEENATISAVEKTSPAVVSIVVSKDLTKLYRDYQQNPFYFSPFLDIPGFEFSVQQPKQGRGTNQNKQKIGGGTGFIITEDGLVLTNKHVVSDPEAEYTVITKDEKQYSAKILGMDALNDIAIVKIEANEKFPVAELGDSDKIKIGQTVLAIGYTLGEFNNTVTKGIISGINRRVVAGNGFGVGEVLEEAIQTDAAINPGNSGGPLLDLSGRVIGINTAMSQSGQLVGFAIPINTAKGVVENVKKNGRLVRAYLGVRYTMITEDIAKEQKLAVNYGAWIVKSTNKGEVSIMPDSPASRAGLKEGDIILEVDGIKLEGSNTLAKVIAPKSPGDKLKMKISRDGKTLDKEVTLEEYKE